MSRAGRGDASAVQALLARYRDRLRRMIAVRLDPRLTPRLDPSDVIQEALIEAVRKLPEFLAERPLPFYPWLRRIAWEHLVKLHERHLEARKRSALREGPPLITDQSVDDLAGRLVAPGTSPSQLVVREEMRQRVRFALAALPDVDREVLVLRYLEQMTTAEVAAVLGMNEGAVKMRHRRALLRLSHVLGSSPERSD